MTFISTKSSTTKSQLCSPFKFPHITIQRRIHTIQAKIVPPYRAPKFPDSDDPIEATKNDEEDVMR